MNKSKKLKTITTTKKDDCVNYAKIMTSFWTGDTGIRISKICDVKTQLLSCYLVCNKHCHMTGVYYLPIGYIVEDLRNVSYEDAISCINELINVGYCKYDFDKKFVWVKNMIRYQVAETITSANNQSVAINKHVNTIESINLNFFDEFYEKYAASHAIRLQLNYKGE